MSKYYDYLTERRVLCSKIVLTVLGLTFQTYWVKWKGHFFAGRTPKLAYFYEIVCRVNCFQVSCWRIRFMDVPRLLQCSSILRLLERNKIVLWWSSPITHYRRLTLLHPTVSPYSCEPPCRTVKSYRVTKIVRTWLKMFSLRSHTTLL